MKHFNIEIKARCIDHKKIRDFLISQNADFTGIDHQIDTYFKTNHGRLKLREGTIENHLIFYERENHDGPKQSNVILFDSDPKSSLKEILTKALGTLIVVDKTREIYFIGNVKFHIDTVKNLGTFIEIESIDSDGRVDRDTQRTQCNTYLKLLGINNDDLISKSYSDLLQEQQNKK